MSSRPAPALSIIAVPGLPLVQPGDDLATLIADACDDAGVTPIRGDVIVIAQKIVSKAEARTTPLASVTPSSRAEELAAIVDKDARLVELVLAESNEVLRAKTGVLVVEQRLGIVLANAGIDASNVDHAGGEVALLLPLDPDASARRIRAALEARFDERLAVLVIDSIGRAWRSGTVGTAIGASGLPALLDLRGRPDLFGRPLATSELGFADEIAAAASLVMGQAAEGCPVVIVRGLAYEPREASAQELLRPRAMDLFR